MRKKILITTLILLLTAFSFADTNDTQSAERIDQAFNRAIAVFALTKGLNGVISVIQGTVVNATPAGVGASFSVGEILDPMNDMIERFSWIMLASTLSLGIQKIMLALGCSLAVQLPLLMMALLSIVLVWIPRIAPPILLNIAFRGLLIVGIIRFAMPLVSFTDEVVYTSILAPRYEESSEALRTTHKSLKEDAEAINTPKADKEQAEPTWMDKLKGTWAATTRVFNFESHFEALKNKLEDASQHILHLMAIFVWQSIIMPLLLLWALLRLIGRVTRLEVAEWFETAEEVGEALVRT